MSSNADFYFCLDGLMTLSSVHCAVCGITRKGLKSCKSCQSTVYCSKECQKAAWPTHKLQCLLQKFLLDATHAMVLQPLGALPHRMMLKDNSGKPGQKRLFHSCSDVFFYSKPPDLVFAMENGLGSYPEIVIRNLQVRGRPEPSLKDNGDVIRFHPLLGCAHVVTGGGANCQDTRLGSVLGEHPEVDMQTLKMLAKALGLVSTSLVSQASSLISQEIIAQEPWIAFPGHTHRLAVSKLAKPERLHDRDQGSVYREINGTPIADENTIEIAKTMLPAASKPPIFGTDNSTVQKSSRKTFDVGTIHFYPHPKAQSAPVSSRLFALPGDRIVSLFFWVAGGEKHGASEADASLIGLKQGDQVLLVDLNTTTGICRILSVKGWHLYVLPETTAEEIGKKLGTELALVHGKTGFPDSLDGDWPEERTNMFQAAKQSMDDYNRFREQMIKRRENGEDPDKLFDEMVAKFDLL